MTHPLLKCFCKLNCQSRKCGCFKNSRRCSDLCTCQLSSCMNPFSSSVEEEEDDRSSDSESRNKFKEKTPQQDFTYQTKPLVEVKKDPLLECPSPLLPSTVPSPTTNSLSNTTTNNGSFSYNGNTAGGGDGHSVLASGNYGGIEIDLNGGSLTGVVQGSSPSSLFTSSVSSGLGDGLLSPLPQLSAIQTEQTALKTSTDTHPSMSDPSALAVVAVAGGGENPVSSSGMSSSLTPSDQNSVSLATSDPLALVGTATASPLAISGSSIPPPSDPLTLPPTSAFPSAFPSSSTSSSTTNSSSTTSPSIPLSSSSLSSPPSNKKGLTETEDFPETEQRRRFDLRKRPLNEPINSPSKPNKKLSRRHSTLDGEPHVPNSSSTAGDVQRWFEAFYPDITSKFEKVTGRGLLSLSERQILQLVPNARGMVLYNQLHPERHHDDR